MEESSQDFTVIDGFEIHEEIGGGAFSRVHVARHIATGTYAAVKIVNLAALQDDEFNGVMREISVFMQVEHPHICALYRLSYHSHQLYFFLEYASGGTLLARINKNKGLPEQECCTLFVQLFSAIRYLHMNHFLVHRDLKLENILLDDKGNIKLTDFGLSGTYYCNIMRTFVGTPGYTPPEVISGSDYDEKCDVWSLGVCLYAMLTARLPFTPQCNNYRLLVDEATNIELPKNFTPVLQDLLKKMLQPKPADRLSIAQLQSHPWLRGLPPVGKNLSPLPIIFYKVNGPEDVSKFTRHSVKPEQKLLEKCQEMGIDIDELTKSLEQGLVNDVTTTYFALKYPMPEKPSLQEEVIPKPNFPEKVRHNSLGTTTFRIRSSSQGQLNRLSEPNAFLKNSSTALRKSTAKAVVSPQRKAMRPPLRRT